MLSFIQVLFKGKDYVIVLDHFYHHGHKYNRLKIETIFRSTERLGSPEPSASLRKVKDL